MARELNTRMLTEVPAPTGWTALLLRQMLPVDDDTQQRAYQDAVAVLLERIPAFAEVHPEEVFLQFAHLRPGLEIKTFQNNARVWMPEFGMGVWLDSPPPQTWTREEFEAAEPGTLRPVVERVVRIARDPNAQRSAWRMLLGSGALLRTGSGTAETFLKGSTEWLRPTITDISFTSFPWYVPLLRASSLQQPDDAYDVPLADQLPGVDAYLRESVEDGGLLLLLRQVPDKVWRTLLATPLPFPVQRLLPPGLDA